MDTATTISIIALTMSAGTLALNVQRWVESGVRLSLSVMRDMEEIPHDDGKPKLGLTVYNRGQQPTTLTHCVVFLYETPLHRLFGKAKMTALVPNPGFNFPNPGIPSKIGPNETWSGRIYYNTLLEARDKGQMYVGVVATNRGRAYLKRVPRKGFKEKRATAAKKAGK